MVLTDLQAEKFFTSTAQTGVNVPLSVLRHPWPPEALLKEVECPTGAGVKVDLGSVGPLRDRRAKVRWHKKPILRATGRSSCIPQSILNLGFDAPHRGSSNA